MELPSGLVKDLLVAADLLSARWKSSNAAVGRRLAEHAAALSATPEMPPPCRFASQCSEEGSCTNGCEARAPVAYLRATSQPDWLEVCQKDEPGAFPVYPGYVR
jgi:hypothetical protein